MSYFLSRLAQPNVKRNHKPNISRRRIYMTVQTDDVRPQHTDAEGKQRIH
jgi:hypothetical protein